MIALTGTALPVLLGWGVMTALGLGGLEGVAAGTALSRWVWVFGTRMARLPSFFPAHTCTVCNF